MEYREQQHRNLCAALAVLTHIIVLCPLFLSFVTQKHQHKQNELTNPLPAINTHLHPRLSAPVVLYSGPIGKPGAQQTSAQKTPPPTQTEKGAAKAEPGIATAATGSDKQNIAQKVSPKAVPKKAPRIIKAHYNGPIIPTRESAQEVPQPATKVITPEKEKPKPEQKSTETKDQAEIPSMFQAAEKPAQEQDSHDADGIRRRRLTLADLFKNMPHLMNKLSQESGDGDQLVVVQGDMKYYSFLKIFLSHINQVFAFHGGPQKMHTFAQSGKLHRNAGLNVVIDREGKVLSRTLTHSSGHEPADQLILEAIDLANPFPPVPSHFTHKTVRIELVSVVR